MAPEIIEIVKKNWAGIKEKFRQDYNLTFVSYNTWIEPLQVGGMTKDGVLEIIFTGENSSFALDHLTKRFSVLMKVTIEEVVGQSVEIRFVSEPKKPAATLYRNQKEGKCNKQPSLPLISEISIFAF